MKKGDDDYSNSYFTPYSAASGHTCSSSSAVPLWSGNYLNWASMQTLDTFRWVLTGGYRSTDTVTTTILSKTYAARDSVSDIPEKEVNASLLAGATPFTSAEWTAGAFTRLRNLGTRMWISGSRSDLITGKNTKGAKPYTGQTSYAHNSGAGYADPDKTYEIYINIKVCDPTVGLEENCVAYGSNYKPEGLLQKYSSKLRFSAFGYYNHNGNETQQRDGGVMRARMKYIGPTQPVPLSSPVSNSHAEWDSSTGVMISNPDPQDASATESFAAAAGWNVTIPNSGVMNYLNKFGYSAKSYKEMDPASELYYAALRYYKNLGNVSSYTTLGNAGDSTTAAKWLDGFPAITSDDVWKKSLTDQTASYGSPILYACQKSFILGIGDVNTHRDGNLPGSVLRSSLEPPMPPEVAADASVNVKTATDMTGRLEGLPVETPLGEYYGDVLERTCPDTEHLCHTYYIAGLAYDAHTRDIRLDLTGSQTVSTYWMDVVEDQIYMRKNQYWMAAKYGGFELPDNFSPYSDSNGPSTLPDSSWYTTHDTIKVDKNLFWYSTNSGDTDKRPDNYFPGDRPETMKSGLVQAFAKIASEADHSTSTALSLASPNVKDGAINYATTYSPKDWTGQLVASTLGFNSSGVPTIAPLWDARDVLEKMITPTDTSSRKIVTCCTDHGAALPFTFATLSTATLDSRTNLASFMKVPGVAEASQSTANYIEYLRGASSQELANGGVYRTRSHRLGDIVNSKPVPVSAPHARYYDVYNPGYTEFKHGKAGGRPTVVYVGGNDGMLHAFDGTAGTSDSGHELFAYIPSFLYGTSSSAATSGLASLGNPGYSHHYFVDATPEVRDIDFNRTHGSAGTAPDWRTLLVGGLGKGGKGYFAIDVTYPRDWSSDTAVAGKVLWEFSDSRLGYTYSTPTLVKTRKYGWVVVFTSGFSNSDGKGYFFFVNPRTGVVLEAVETPEGSEAQPLDMAFHTAFIPDYTDFTADAIYAGDLRGNVWRVDVSGTSSDYEVTKIAHLTDANETPQPVTTAPTVEIEPNSKKRYVLVGTGRLLADSDISNANVQSFYAINDGTSSSGGFYTSSSLPGGGSFPVTRGQLEANTDLLAGIGSAPSHVMGWYLDLGVTNNIAERVNVQPSVNNGVLTFAANLPNGEVCAPSGTGTMYAVSLAAGKSVLVDGNSAPIASQHSSSIVTDLKITNVNGSIRVYGGNSKGEPVLLPTATGIGTNPLQINWREVRPGS
ncbi:MAG TPA: PilC/PilY family type IV pilus protein [Burkholderiaceae bacterium]|nr:PilC/PilY family type IV pilus protein [Burkholderiaceae bacterium]